MLTLPNFERLKIFHVVYQTRSIQKSADQFSVTRSAISQSLKLLEEEMGTRLFIRTSKKFQSTPEADQVFQAIEPFIFNLREALKKNEMRMCTPSGHLRIGAPLDFGAGLLTTIIGKFCKRFPQVTYELTLAIPVKQLELLCDGKLDFAFIDNGDIHTKKFPVTVQNIMKEEFVVAASPVLFKKYGLDNPGFVKWMEIPVVDYLPHAPVFRMWLKHHFIKRIDPMNVVYSAESVRAVINAISAEIGVGVVPRLLIAGELRHLKIIETSKGHFINQIIIARQLGKNVNTREKEFIHFCRDELKRFK